MSARRIYPWIGLWVPLAIAQAADDPSAPRAMRSYDKTITLHAAPMEAERIPTNRETRAGGSAPAPSAFDSNPGLTARKPPEIVPPPRLRPQESSPNNNNWLTSKTGPATPDEKKPKPSGWGWLADEVLQSSSRAQEKQRAESEEESESMVTNLNATRDRTADTAPRPERETYRPTLTARVEDRGTVEARNARPGPDDTPDRDITTLDQYANRVFSMDPARASSPAVLTPSTDRPTEKKPGGLDSELRPGLSIGISSDSFRPAIASPSFSGGSLLGESSPGAAPGEPTRFSFSSPSRFETAPASAPPTYVDTSRQGISTPSIGSALDKPAIVQPRALPW